MGEAHSGLQVHARCMMHQVGSAVLQYASKEEMVL